MLKQQKYVCSCLQVIVDWSCETQGEGPIHKRQNYFPNQLFSDPSDPWAVTYVPSPLIIEISDFSPQQINFCHFVWTLNVGMTKDC